MAKLKVRGRVLTTMLRSLATMVDEISPGDANIELDELLCSIGGPRCHVYRVTMTDQPGAWLIAAPDDFEKLAIGLARQVVGPRNAQAALNSDGAETFLYAYYSNYEVRFHRCHETREGNIWWKEPS